MTVFWNKQTLVALLASLLFIGMSVGCGPKSGGSNDRVAAPESAPAVDPSSDADPGEKPTPESSETGSPEDPKIFQKNQDSMGQGEDEGVNEKIKEVTYEQIEKDRMYDLETTNSSDSVGARYGEFGAVLFDDSMWYPGLPDFPAGHSDSILTPIFTQAKSESEYLFTDGKSDDLMAYAIEKSEKIADLPKKHPDLYSEDFLLESRYLAKRVQDVRLNIDTYETANVSLYMKLADGDTAHPLKLEFHGKLDGRRIARLEQRNIKGDKDLTFLATVMCMDEEGGCQNAVIQISQIKGGKTCRMAYLVYRSGDAHITMSSADRLYFEASHNSKYQAFANYLSNTAFNSCLSNKRRSDFPNRLIQHLRAYCGQTDDKKTPAAKSIGLRTWAVAFGPSAFQLTFEEAPQFVGDQHAETFSIQGPLVYASHKNPIYSRKLKVVGRGFFASRIQSAHLVNNDGGGNLNLLLRFSGESEEELRFSSTSLIRRSIAPSQVPKIQQLSDDPRG